MVELITMEQNVAWNFSSKKVLEKATVCTGVGNCPILGILDINV
jgi:hypothetical protein